MPLIGTYAWEGAIMRTSPVRAVLHAQAQRQALMVRAWLVAAGYPNVPVTVTEGTRPGTKAREGARRPFVRISIPAEYEYGSASTPRLRVLARIGRLQ